MTTLIVIPARYESSRFPGKLLRTGRDGKTVLQHVWDNAVCSSANKIVIATDSEAIKSEVAKWGEYVTTGLCACGTDRAAAVWCADREKDKYEIIINLQADEVEITSDYIDHLINFASARGHDSISTMATPLNNVGIFSDNNAVKVVCSEPIFGDKHRQAIYFSRSSIPNQQYAKCDLMDAYLHIGIYAFKPCSLMKFAEHKQSTLEKVERLEQLRAITYGAKIDVTIVDSPPALAGKPWPIAINSIQDLCHWLQR